MDLSLITARIIDQVDALTPGSRVAGAAELLAAIVNREQLVLPCAFVLWTGDTPLEQNPIPGQEARFREDFAVVVAVDNSVDRRGAGAVATVETLGNALATALVGWLPSSSHLPVYYTGSTHVDMNPTRLLHSFNYSTVKPGGSIHRYQLGFRLRLLANITFANVKASLATKVDDVIGASTRLDSDYNLDREAIPEGATRYQLILAPVVVDDRSDTSAALLDVDVQLSVYHHFAPGATERDYTEGTMTTALATLQPSSYWRDATKIREVLSAPELGLGGDLARE